MKKWLLAAIAACICSMLNAQGLPSVVVKTPDQTLQIPIANISEITFTDTEMTVAKDDGTSATFPSADNWVITFADDNTGVATLMADSQYPILVYDLKGILVKEIAAGGTLNSESLPKGIYVVKYGNRQFKIQR